MVREGLRTFCESAKFNNFILILIVINAIIIGLLTFNFSESSLMLLDLIDDIILVIFIVEMLIKIYSYGPEFFEDPWNNFDLIIIAVSAAPIVSSVSVLRVLRVFKVLRIVRVFPELRKMVEATLRSVRSILAISALLCIVVYIYAVMCHMLFGQSAGVGSEYFGDLGKSIFSLFQVMTLDSWADGMVRELMIEYGAWVAIFFALFILSTTFTFLNLFVAVFTNTMASIDIEDGDNIGFSRIINEIKSELSELRIAYNNNLANSSLLFEEE